MIRPAKIPAAFPAKFPAKCLVKCLGEVSREVHCEVSCGAPCEVSVKFLWFNTLSNIVYLISTPFFTALFGEVFHQRLDANGRPTLFGPLSCAGWEREDACCPSRSLWAEFS